MRGEDDGARVIVGRDPRFLGETFCSIASEILSSYGITPLVIAEPAPTPAISYAVMHEKADGAINFTASHNPPEYNGIKFSTADGAPALPEVTKQIEAYIAALDREAAAADMYLDQVNRVVSWIAFADDAGSTPSKRPTEAFD